MATIAGAITDQQAVGTCSLAGIHVMKGRLFDLIQLQRAIQINMNETVAAQSDAEFARRAVLGLKLTKASCDAFIAIVGELTGPPGKALSAAYFGASPMAEALGVTAAGGSVGAGGWTKAAVAGANAATKVIAPNNPYSDLGDLQKIKTDLVVDAVHSDIEKVIADMLSYTAKVAEMSAKAVGRAAVGKVIAVGTKLVGAGRSYVAAYQEYQRGDSAKTNDQIRRAITVQHLSVQQAISDLQLAIANCEQQLSRPTSRRNV